jgi:hypothetical protein
MDEVEISNVNNRKYKSFITTFNKKRTEISKIYNTNNQLAINFKLKEKGES